MQGEHKAATNDEYIDGLDEPRRSELRALHELVRAAAPGLAPTMEFGMPGYGKYHYRYDSGREGDAALVSFLVLSRISVSSGIALRMAAGVHFAATARAASGVLAWRCSTGPFGTLGAASVGVTNAVTASAVAASTVADRHSLAVIVPTFLNPIVGPPSRG